MSNALRPHCPASRVLPMQGPLRDSPFPVLLSQPCLLSRSGSRVNPTCPHLFSLSKGISDGSWSVVTASPSWLLASRGGGEVGLAHSWPFICLPQRPFPIGGITCFKQCLILIYFLICGFIRISLFKLFLSLFHPEGAGRALFPGSPFHHGNAMFPGRILAPSALGCI